MTEDKRTLHFGTSKVVPEEEAARPPPLPPQDKTRENTPSGSVLMFGGGPSIVQVLHEARGLKKEEKK